MADIFTVIAIKTAIVTAFVMLKEHYSVPKVLEQERGRKRGPDLSVRPKLLPKPTSTRRTIE